MDEINQKKLEIKILEQKILDEKNKVLQPRFLGYCRVSTIGQCLITQKNALLNAGCKEHEIFCDKISGIKFNRKGLSDLFQYSIDHSYCKYIVLVSRIDRLGRNVFKLIQLHDKIRSFNMSLKSLDCGLIDPSNPSSLLTFHIQASIAEHFYGMNRIKTLNGIKIAIQKGKMGAEHSYKANDIQTALDMRAEGMSVKKICSDLNVCRRTYYRMIKQNPNTFKPRIHKKNKR